MCFVFVVISGATSIDWCLPCPIGSASPSIASGSRCPACAAGTYQDQVGQRACTPCPASTFNPLTGSSNITSCIACGEGLESLPGSFSVTQCIPPLCPVGFYTDRSKCDSVCPSGHYCDGAQEAKICETGTYAPEKASKCTECPAGTFSNIQVGIKTPHTQAALFSLIHSVMCDLSLLTLSLVFFDCVFLFVFFLFLSFSPFLFFSFFFYIRAPHPGGTADLALTEPMVTSSNEQSSTNTATTHRLSQLEHSHRSRLFLFFSLS